MKENKTLVISVIMQKFQDKNEVEAIIPNGVAFRQTLHQYLRLNNLKGKFKTKTKDNALVIYRYEQKKDVHSVSRPAVKLAAVNDIIVAPASESAYISALGRKYGKRFKMLENKGDESRYLCDTFFTNL